MSGKGEGQGQVERHETSARPQCCCEHPASTRRVGRRVGGQTAVEYEVLNWSQRWTEEGARQRPVGSKWHLSVETLRQRQQSGRRQRHTQ